MTDEMSPADLLRLRMHALGLGPNPDGPGAPRGAAETGGDGAAGAERIAATARRMLASQGQDWRSARWALGVRTPGTTVDDVTAAFDEGLIVRSWPMRGTIHVVAAEDIGWMQGVTKNRMLAGAAKRREYLGMSDAALDALVAAAVEALEGGGSLDRDELSAVWTEAGLEWQSSWRYHLIWWLCQNGITTLGPAAGGEPRLILADDWIRAPRRLEGDEALAEFAARYAGARGPVTAKDFAWWSGLTMKDVKRGFALAAEAGRLTPVRVADASPEYWVAPETLDALAGTEAGTGAGAAGASKAWLLLPAFDEHLLGYTDRSAQLDPAHFERIVPGRNGMFLATAVHGGRVVGTWKRGARKGEGINATALPGERLEAAALDPAAERWGVFHGRDETPIAVV